MATLIEGTKSIIKHKRQTLKEAVAAGKMVRLLPEEIQSLDGDADTGYGSCGLRLSFSQSCNKDIDLLRFFKTLGAQGLNPTMFSPDNWYAEGTFTIGENITVRVDLFSLPNPPQCRIEEYEEMVTKYRAICPETGEEL